MEINTAKMSRMTYVAWWYSFSCMKKPSWFNNTYYTCFPEITDNREKRLETEKSTNAIKLFSTEE